MKLTLLFALVVVGVSAFPQKRNTGCNSFCPMYIIQFCGSDGKTYNSNECFIKSRMCSEGNNGFGSFKSLHYGACTGKELIDEQAKTDPTTTAAPLNSIG